jgi:hypothetical protein
LKVLNRSTCGLIWIRPKLNGRDSRRSSIVTLGSRSSPRSDSHTVWFARVSAGNAARVIA